MSQQTMTQHSSDLALTSLSHPLPFHEVDAGSISPAIDALLARAKNNLEKIESVEVPTYERVMRALDEMDSSL